jgi:hypothetical protein
MSNDGMGLMVNGASEKLNEFLNANVVDFQDRGWQF